MNSYFISRRIAIRTLSVLAIVCSSMLAVGFSATPAEADLFKLGRSLAVGENAAVGRTRGFVSNGEGVGALRRGGFATDRQGNGIAGRGGCVSGLIVDGCRGGTASWNADGSFSGQSGAAFSGENHLFNTQRNVARDAAGNMAVARSTDASGERGDYSGNSSFDDGAYSRDATYTGNEGQAASVEGDWVLGSGGSRAVSCVDAAGGVVDCN